MLFVKNIEVEFGGRVLFQDLSFAINPGERITFAGYNGTGKSTLMKVLLGKVEPTAGEISMAKDLSIGYLPQDGIQISGKTLFAEVESAFDEIIAIQKKIDALGEKMSKIDHNEQKYHDLLHEMSDLQVLLNHHDIDRIKPQIESVLFGLGFAKSDLSRDTGEFSGGWQMRIAMAKLLLRAPDVLLLDEPTNHLDFDSQRWMENYLHSYNGALVLISHDKGLLDKLCKRTLAFSHGKVSDYSGNYSYFLKESAARKEQLIKAKEVQDKEIKLIQDFINRFRYNSKKAPMVQSRIKMLDKIERIVVDRDDAVVKFSFPQPPKSGHSIMQIENVKKQYGDNLVFENLNLHIEKGDCIAVVGVNGAGKSTFVRLLAGVEEPTAGDIKLGHNVLPSYFSQTLSEELPMDQTIMQTVEENCATASLGSVRNVLGCFLFRGNDVFKINSVLSGGERSRVALVRMLLQPANFLIMDEPTNHLDIPSQDILQYALKSYSGTMVIVSHNKQFLDPIVNKVIEFVPNSPPKIYLGNMSDYIAKKERDALSAKQAVTDTTNKKTNAKSLASLSETAKNIGETPNFSTKNKKEQRRLKALFRQEYNKKVKPLKDKLDLVEEKIKNLEAEQAVFSEKMLEADFASKEENIIAFSTCSQSLNSAYTQWENLHKKIEAIETTLTHEQVSSG